MLINNNTHFCLARGLIKNSAKLQAGDSVDVKLINDKYVIVKMHQRKNQLTRPYISNIDQLIIVVASQPKPNFLLVDKLLIGCIYYNITPIIVVNKSDINSELLLKDIIHQYEQVTNKIIQTSATTNCGINELKQLLKNKLSAFCGQSAVGKTSLINAIFGNLNLKTNELSKKINAGKNTTRETQIFAFDNNTLIADTPGFNMLHHPPINPAELGSYYPEFALYSDKCQFKNCTHINKAAENCGVINAKNMGNINALRYERYIQLYNKISEIWRNKYD